MGADEQRGADHRIRYGGGGLELAAFAWRRPQILRRRPLAFSLLYGNLEQRRIEKDGVRREAMAISRLAAASQRSYIKNTKQLLGTLTQFPFLLLTTNREFSG